MKLTKGIKMTEMNVVVCDCIACEDGFIIEDHEVHICVCEYCEIKKAKIISDLKALPNFCDFKFDTMLESTTAWEDRWTNINPNIDPVEMAADLYLLFGIANGTFVKKGKDVIPTDKDVEKAASVLQLLDEDVQTRCEELALQREASPISQLKRYEDQASILYNELVEKRFDTFFEYVILACGGEFRHAVKSMWNYPNNRRAAWAEAHTLYHSHGVQFLRFMEEAFLHILNDGSYGGPPWAAAARLAADYLEGKLGLTVLASKQMFLDRVCTMQHNNGALINKRPWANNRKHMPYEYAYDYYYMHGEGNVLDAHAANPTNIDHLYEVSSKDVRLLTRDYLDCAVVNRLDVRGTWSKGIEISVAPSSSPKADSDLKTIAWEDVDGNMFQPFQGYQVDVLNEAIESAATAKEQEISGHFINLKPSDILIKKPIPNASFMALNNAQPIAAAAVHYDTINPESVHPFHTFKIVPSTKINIVSETSGGAIYLELNNEECNEIITKYHPEMFDDTTTGTFVKHNAFVFDSLRNWSLKDDYTPSIRIAGYLQGVWHDLSLPISALRHTFGAYMAADLLGVTYSDMYVMEGHDFLFKAGY